MAYLGGLTGWSGGGRRPLTYNLMPGQMRNTRVNVFQNNYMMPMGACYYADPCQCNHDDGMPKWMQWMMGIGMGSSLLGSILSGISGGGGGSTEGAGGAAKQNSELADVQAMYSKYNIREIDGKYVAKAKDGKGERISADNLNDLMDQLDNANTTTTTSPTQTTTINPALKAYCEGLGITITTDGKFKVGDQEYEKLADAVNAANQSSSQQNGAPVSQVQVQPQVAQQTVAQTPLAQQQAQAPATPTLPNLFNQTGMAGLTTESAVLDKFKNLTGADAVKIDGSGNISINTVVDSGNGTKKTVNINISPAQLQQLKNGTEVQLSNIGTKAVTAKSVDGYLQIKVGSQTYMVGKDASEKLNGYQYKDGNVIGYSEANWRRGEQ